MFWQGTYPFKFFAYPELSFHDITNICFWKILDWFRNNTCRGSQILDTCFQEFLMFLCNFVSSIYKMKQLHTSPFSAKGKFQLTPVLWFNLSSNGCDFGVRLFHRRPFHQRFVVFGEIRILFCTQLQTGKTFNMNPYKKRLVILFSVRFQVNYSHGRTEQSEWFVWLEIAWDISKDCSSPTMVKWCPQI